MRFRSPLSSCLFVRVTLLSSCVNVRECVPALYCRHNELLHTKADVFAHRKVCRGRGWEGRVQLLARLVQNYALQNHLSFLCDVLPKCINQTNHIMSSCSRNADATFNFLILLFVILNNINLNINLILNAFLSFFKNYWNLKQVSKHKISQDI